MIWLIYYSGGAPILDSVFCAIFITSRVNFRCDSSGGAKTFGATDWPTHPRAFQHHGRRQVWPLTQYFFLLEKIVLPIGEHYSLPFLPATPSSPSRTLEGLFELTQRPCQALDSPRALLPELQRYKDTVRCAAPGAEVPGHRQQQLT